MIDLAASMAPTAENYHSKENAFISNSKVRDWMKSRALYAGINVTGEIRRKLTPAMKVGTMVDLMVCRDPKVPYVLPYQVKVLKKDNPVLFEEQKDMDDELLISADKFDEARARAAAIVREPFFDFYRQGRTIWQPVHSAIVHWNGRPLPVCGKPDGVTDLGDDVYVDDCKSSSYAHAQSAAKWFYHAEDMGYFRAGGNYVDLVRRDLAAKGRTPRIHFRHFVVYDVGEGLYRMALFVIPPLLLEEGHKQFLAGAAEIFDAIQAGEFADPPARWEDAVVLERPRRLDPSDFMDDGEGEL